MICASGSGHDSPQPHGRMNDAIVDLDACDISAELAPRAASKRLVRSSVIGLALVIPVHFLTLAVAFTYASGWDSACEILYREENLTGDPAAAREGERSYYVDPGFTCEYLVNGEWIMLRRDMTGTRNTVFVITAAAALIAVTGVFIYNLKARDPGWDPDPH